MKIYECSICGNRYDDSSRDKPFDTLSHEWECDICGAPKAAFSCNSPDTAVPEQILPEATYENTNPLAYPSEYFRPGDEHEKSMALIHELAVTGTSVIEPMGTRLPVVGWDDVLFLGAQLSPFPLDENAPIDVGTVIGKHAKKPLRLENPVYISHMSFGALSREIKIALATGANMSKSAMCSGEGGILPEEFEAAHQYIFEYVPNQYSVTDENLKKVDAIEIKIGQGTKPGMGGHLPGSKVTDEIAAVRGKVVGEDIISPSRFPDIHSKEDLKQLVNELRERSDGRPIGIKIAAGHIEADLAAALFASPDFITIDGRGGGTGASPKFLKDASTIPTLFALSRARKYLDARMSDVSLVITGGLRTSSDIVKALALGADAVALASAVLMAAACQQYRVCHNGKCPTGTMTQDPALRKNVNIGTAAKRVANFLNVTRNELKTFARVSGHRSIHDLSVGDLATANSEISHHTDIRHV